MSVELLHVIDQVGREKGIDPSILVEALEAAVLSACRKKYSDENLEASFNKKTGEVELFFCKEVVKTVEHPDKEIDLKSAKKIDSNAKLEDIVKIPFEREPLGRVAAQIAKQVIIQKVREAETDIVLKEFSEKKGELVNGVVLRQERGDIIVELGKAEGILPRKEQVYKEDFKRGERIKALLLDVRRSAKGAQVILSRTHPALLTSLFQMEVPEITEGIVEVKGAVREPNGRSKIAVLSKEKSVDAVGSCVGMRGVRVQAVVAELRGEKVDIIQWSDNPTVFAKNALSPAKIGTIVPNENEKHLLVIVPDDQLSLAIGKRGQNVRLASRLLNWSIDIKSESEYQNDLENKGALSAVSDSKFIKELCKVSGLGNVIANLLIEHDLIEPGEIEKIGTEGLTKISGIGLKTAEKIVETFQDFEIKATVLLETDIEKLETSDIDDYPIDELKGIGKKTLDILNANGHQTVAELSAAEIDELISFEGIGAKKAESILKNAQEFMEKHENA
jgi:N utilization substance protein A